MPRAFSISLLLLAAAGLCAAAGPRAARAAQTSAAAPASQPETVDRIVARVEDDVILLSEVRELAAYQQLVDGHSQSQEKLIAALIEQWVVRSEAQEAQFSSPPAADIDAEAARIQAGFPSAQAYRDRLAAVGLTPQALRRIIEQQLYLERYLDYKFRPAVQIDDAAVLKYYQDELTPALTARGQTPPPLDDVRDQIVEVLVQRGINERADSWFDETKSRLQIEITPAPTVNGKL
jgi:peptidyl-prolyl cis-trans isomerase SurA